MKEKRIDRAKRELNEFKELYEKVWNEDLTDETELLCLKFFKAGLKCQETPNE